jgi:hypothetical protein
LEKRINQDRDSRQLQQPQPTNPAQVIEEILIAAQDFVTPIPNTISPTSTGSAIIISEDSFDYEATSETELKVSTDASSFSPEAIGISSQTCQSTQCELVNGVISAPIDNQCLLADTFSDDSAFGSSSLFMQAGGRYSLTPGVTFLLLSRPQSRAE